MSTPTALRFREARNRMIELLRLGETYPVRDLAVREGRLTVTFGSTAKIPIEISQPGVTYSLRDKHGNAASGEIVGTGDTLLIETPSIRDDTTFTVHARMPSGREADLLALATVKVGLDLDLAAAIAPETAPGPRVVDYGAAVVVQIAQSQDGVDYRLVQFPAGDPQHPDDMAAAANDDVLSEHDKTVRGTGGPIALPSKQITEDTLIRIRAIKVFDAALDRPPQTNILAARLPLLVRADPGRPVASDPAPIIPYQGACSVRLSQTQKGAFYRAFAHVIADSEYQQGATPGPGLAAIKVDGEPDAMVLLPGLPGSGDDLPGFTTVGEEQAGTGADLLLALPPAAGNRVVAVQARKRHQLTGAPVVSAVWLAQLAVVLTRPDPNAKPLLRVTLRGGRTTGALDVIGGQEGVFYTPRIMPPGTPILPPAYVHKRDPLAPALNKGLGQLKLEVDFVLARDPPEGGGPLDLARTAPLPPSLVTDPLEAGVTLALRAMEAQTRVSADLAASAVIEPIPELHSDTLVDFGAEARIEVPGSRPNDRYALLGDEQRVGAAQDGTGATLVFLSDPLRRDAVLEISAVSKAALPVDRRSRFSVAVRPQASLAVRARNATVSKGADNLILVDASQANVAYQLMSGAVPIGTPVSGTGATITLSTGPIDADTTFSVRATRTDVAGATVTLTQTAPVAVKAA